MYLNCTQVAKWILTILTTMLTQMPYFPGEPAQWSRQWTCQYIPSRSTCLGSGQVELAAGHDLLFRGTYFASSDVENRSRQKRIRGHDSLERIHDTTIKFVAVMGEIYVQKSVRRVSSRTVDWSVCLYDILLRCGKVGRGVRITVTNIYSIGHWFGYPYHRFTASLRAGRT